MASVDVDDLIREADEALAGIVSTPWTVWPNDEYWCSFDFVQDGYEDSSREEVDKTSAFIAAAPDLVRRLRDALADSADYRMAREANAAAIDAMNERDRLQAALDEMREYSANLRDDLAEANATIARIEALHVQVRVCTDVRTGVWRWECGTCGEAGDGGEWPCDTTKAIEGER